MTSPRLRRARLGTVAAGLLTITLVPGLTQLPALAATHAQGRANAGRLDRPLPGARNNDAISTLADAVPGLSNMDQRGRVLPTLTQKRAAAKLDAVDLRWNQFGTPDSILPADGVLASGYSKDPNKAPIAARDWIMKNRAAFGLSAAQVSALTLVNNQKLAASPARAVLFRQNFGKLSPALDSMITVGVARGQVDYVSSSITRAKDLSALKDTVISPVAGWLDAAADVGRVVSVADKALIKPVVAHGWTTFMVPGFANLQYSRLRSLAMSDGTVRPVYEVNVTDVQGGSAFAYTSMVDAVTGRVLNRQNKVLNDNDSSQYNGSITATTCGPMHKFELKDGATKTIAATAAMANSADDIVLKIFDPSGTAIASGDEGTSPEAATATSKDGFAKGIYAIQVCPFIDPMVPDTPPFNYAAGVNTSNTNSAPSTGSPRWRSFVDTPTLSSIDASTPHNSTVACWYQKSKGCTYPLGQLRNVQAPGPWDTNAGSGASSMTTVGNNANTHEAWLSPLTPGGTAQAPVSAARSYTTPFTDAWNNSRCNPTELHVGGNDINASVTDLFVTHNLMHDYSYYLGYTEANYNNQLDNLGRGGKAGDQETGNAQAGAIDGGYPSFEGRDNANQIPEQDGVPGITNQYLFQPIAGAFYAPCTDGSLDFGIVGHEYTHEISNRMIGGPDQGITSVQGDSMGESWSDLNAAEFLFSHGYGSKEVNPFAVGVYATQNQKVAIRDYSIDHNPLNYSDFGSDTPGPEVHADGEIWNGTQWSVRQALVTKYNKQFPYNDKHLQLQCSNAATMGPTSSPLPVKKCPGNRRWIQMIYDGWLLEPPGVSMLTARDSMLASNMMRFGGKDLDVMWKAFAARGMGEGAHIKSADDDQPTPSFSTPTKYGKDVKVTFKNNGNYGKVYVGMYEARVTPVADTNPKTKLKDSFDFAPGKYQMLFVSQRSGFTRFKMTVKAGAKTMFQKIKSPRDLASTYAGAKLIGTTKGSLNPLALLDGTEATNWAGVTTANVDASHPYVALDLAGGVSTIRRVNVSAYLHPPPGTITDEVPLLAGEAADPDSASRFTALRQFALEACIKNCSAKNAVWKRFYTSSPKAFPATLPRPVAPDLIMRTFKVPPTKAAAIKFIALENQCTGNKQYAGEQDSDPTNNTDCKTASDRGTIVHAAELQVYVN